MKNIILTILLITIGLSSNTQYLLKENNLHKQDILIENGNYKLFSFKKRILDIRISKSDLISVSFIENKKDPFKKIKIFTKKSGIANVLITSPFLKG